MISYGISLLSLIPMRKEPKEQAEMVSQLLFGESYEIIDESNGFVQIITTYDGYTGWIDHAMHFAVSEEYYHNLRNEIPAIQTSLMMSIERKGFPPIQILAGSTLPGLNKKKDQLEINGEAYHVRWTFGKFENPTFDTVLETASYFLNSPYLWGGRSIFGCDCSGFVQVLFKIHGIVLKRDTYQQVAQGMTVSALDEAKTGDLAFFADNEGKVYHVGMIISPGEIIHSLGYVHIDRLDDKGIFNLQKQQYTHSLHSIRRYR